MMSDRWYRFAPAHEPLTQGDLVLSCPVVGWRSNVREVFTLPRQVLETLLVARNRDRPQLLPPYREHLSQAFARFFMRVGLPAPITKVW